MRAILDALRNRDADAAHRLAPEHVHMVAKAALATFDSSANPPYRLRGSMHGGQDDPGLGRVVIHHLLDHPALPCHQNTV